MKKKIFALLLIGSLLQLPAYSAEKSRKVSDEDMTTLTEMATKSAEKTKVKKFKHACDGLIELDWGTSYKEVVKLFGDKILSKDKESIFVESNIKELPGYITYTFEEGKLSGAAFIPSTVHENEEDYIKDFENIYKFVNENYGSENCVEAEIPRNMSVKAVKYAKKIQKGESYTNMWLVNDQKTFISQYIELNEEYDEKDPESQIFDVALVVMDAKYIDEEEVDEEAENEEIANDGEEEEEAEEEVKETPKKKKAKEQPEKANSNKKSSKEESSDKKSSHTTVKKYKGSCIDLVTFKWGDSSDKVKKETEWPLISDTGNSLFYKGYYCKRTAEVEFIFENNKLTQVCYAFNIPNDKKEDYTNDFIDVSQAIYEKLGNCVHFDVPEDIEDNPGKVAASVIKGKTELTSMYSYNNGKTGVRHFMRQMTTDDGSKPDCPVDHFIGVWDNSKKNLHKNLE